MKRTRTYILLAMLGMALPLSAQHTEGQTPQLQSAGEQEVCEKVMDLQTDEQKTLQKLEESAPRMEEDVEPAYTGITLTKTPLGYRPLSSLSSWAVPYFHGWGGMGYWGGLWDIHEGFNANIETGVMVGFGKNNPWKGGHFFTSLSGLYAKSINDRLTLAAGLNYSQITGMNMGGGMLGIFALANYRINDRLDLTGFISRQGGVNQDDREGMRFSTHMPYMPGYYTPSTTVGADLGIKVGENTKINLGVSFTREDNNFGPPQKPQRITTDYPTNHQMDR